MTDATDDTLCVVKLHTPLGERLGICYLHEVPEEDRPAAVLDMSDDWQEIETACAALCTATEIPAYDHCEGE